MANPEIPHWAVWGWWTKPHPPYSTSPQGHLPPATCQTCLTKEPGQPSGDPSWVLQTCEGDPGPQLEAAGA